MYFWRIVVSRYMRCLEDDLIMVSVTETGNL